MKISEMTNDQAADALVRIAGPFDRICNDDDLLEALTKLGSMTGVPVVKVIGQALPMFVTVGLKKHKADLYEIIGALTLTPASRVGKMNFKETLKAIQDSFDDTLRDFFTVSATAIKIAARK